MKTKKKKMSMEEVEFLPEILVNILSRLPVESILECKCICKAWKTLIHDPLFLATYTAHHQSFFSDGDGDGFCIMGRQSDFYGSTMVHYGEYRRRSTTININASSEEGGGCFKVTKPIKSPHKWFKEEDDIGVSWYLIGSSNGLICFSVCVPGYYEKYTYNIYVYNPMTKEYVNLGPETFARRDWCYRAMRFGYHPSTNEYKVIRINCSIRHSSGQVKVYTLGGGRRSDHMNSSTSKSRWRGKGEIPYLFTPLYQPGVLVNGALHWLANDNKIVCFDLADEEFRNVPVRSCIVLSKDALLGVLGGRLCVYVNNSVWLLKEYMMEESWTKIFSRENDEPLKEEDVVLRSCGGSAAFVTFVSNFPSKKRNDVVSYNSESGSISIVSKDIEWFKKYSRLDIVSYTKSFVSLKALGEKDVQYS